MRRTDRPPRWATRVRRADGHRFKPLESYWAGAAEVFADVDSPMALAFIQRCPSPDAASRLGPQRMAAFSARHAGCGRRSADELPQRLRQAPSAGVGELEMDANGELAASLARAGRICAAQILAELGSMRERFDADEHLAAEAGAAAVTCASGKHEAVVFRWACNHRLLLRFTPRVYGPQTWVTGPLVPPLPFVRHAGCASGFTRPVGAGATRAHASTLDLAADALRQRHVQEAGTQLLGHGI